MAQRARRFEGAVQKLLSEVTHKYELYHQELTGFSECSKSHRARDSDWVTSKAVLSLPCQVPTHIPERKIYAGMIDLHVLCMLG